MPFSRLRRCFRGSDYFYFKAGVRRRLPLPYGLYVTPSVFMDYSAGDGPGNRTNPISGKAWGWPQNYITFAYEGEI